MQIKFHNSDFQKFKNCRRDWDLGSDLRQSWKPIEVPQPLAFGSASHAAWQFYYEPSTWHLVQDPTSRPFVVAGAIERFREEMRAGKFRYLKLTNKEAFEPEQQEKYLQDLDLGEGMLRNYFAMVERNQLDEFTPIAVEVGFAVPLFTPAELHLFFPHLITKYGEDLEILFCGRIDLIMQDKFGNVWIWDHKTAAWLKPTLNFLELDEQLGSYNWALEIAHGIKVEGNVYAQTRKGYPRTPEPMKVVRLGRRFSTAKDQETDYETFKAGLIAAGEPLALYEDYLNFLQNEGVEYIKRRDIRRNSHELRNLYERMRMQAMDILQEDLRIYPSPGPFKCDYCDMRQVCLAMNDGSDVDWILNEYYVQEERTNA